MTMDPTIERLMCRSDHDVETGCLLWRGETTERGYGRIKIKGRRRRVHQVAWEILRGPRPPGLVPDHTCRRPNCWNPDHLDWVTSRVNILRGTGPTATNARKTHCAKGHEFTPENTRVRASRPTSRECRKCSNIHNADRKKRRMAELRALKAL